MHLTFQSRVFSSTTLMDGEELLSAQDLDGLGDIELEAELRRLKDWTTWILSSFPFGIVHGLRCLQASFLQPQVEKMPVPIPMDKQ